MKIYCQDCRKELFVQNINIQNFIAKCHHCDSVFQLDSNFQNDNAQSEILDIPCPKNIHVIRTTHELVIELKHQPIGLYIMLFLSSLLSFLFSLTLVPILKMYYWAVLFLGVFLVIWIFVLLKKHFGKIVIQVNSQEITVNRDALSFKRKNVFPTPSIKQLYCEEYIVTSDDDHYTRYDIMILTNNGEQIPLLSSVCSSEESLFIEQEIEKYLNIVDKKFPGEFKER